MLLPHPDLGLFPSIYRAAIQRMLADYGHVFGGRELELAALDAFFERGGPPYGLMLAPTGRGKTALLIHWLAHVRQRSARAILLSISRRYQTASAQVALGAAATALAAVHGETLAGQTMAPDQLRPLIADYLGRDLPADQRLIVILDGMDEAVGWQVNHELFPPQPGRGIQMLGAARQLAHATAADWCAQLGWPIGMVRQFDLPVLGRAAISALAEAAGLPLLDAHVSQLARVSGGDPLTLRLLVEALRHGTLAPENLTRQPPGLEHQLQAWLADLLHDSQPAAIRTLLALCAQAFGPLTRADIQALAPDLGGDAIQTAARAVGRFILGDGSAEHGYVFSHPRLRETYQERVLTTDERRRGQQQFIAYGRRWMATRRTPLPDYLRQFWIAHLAEAGAWDTASAALTHIATEDGVRRQPWAAARYAAEGSHTGYLSDLDLLWRRAEQTYDLSLGVRCALIAGSLRSMSADLTPRLLVKLVTVGTPAGRWSIAAALDHLRHMPEPAWSRPWALEALITAMPDLPPEPILEIIRTLLGPEDKARLLIAYAGVRPETDRRQLYIEALENDSGVIVLPDSAWAADILPTLIDDLAPDTIVRLLLELASHAASSPGQTDWRQPLARLLEHLPDAIIGRAFDAAVAQENIWQRLNSVVGLVSTGRQSLVSAAFPVLAELPDERARAVGISDLAPHLPADLVRTAFDLALRMAERQSRHITLSSLAARLPADLVDQLFALAIAGDDEDRAALLPDLAPRLAPGTLEQALDLVRTIADADKRDDTLGRLLPSLHSQPIETIFQVIAELPKPLSRLIGLVQLRPRLGAEHLSRIDRDLADLLSDPQLALESSWIVLMLPLVEPPARVLPQPLIDLLWDTMRRQFHAITAPQIVGALMRHPPSINQAELYAELVEAICANDDEQLIGSALHPMIPVLTPALQQRVLDWVRSARLGGVALGVITGLAGRLQPALLRQAVEIVSGIAATSESRRCVDALVELAQHFPAHEQPGMYHHALLLAQRIQDSQEQVRVLLALMPAVQPARRAAIYRWLRDRLDQAVERHYSFDQVLAQADRLPAPIRRRVQRMLLDISRTNPALLLTGLRWFHGRRRNEAAARLMQYLEELPPQQHDDGVTMQALVAAIPVLPRALLGQAERVARRCAEHPDYPQALAMLAQRGQVAEQRTLYAEVDALIRRQPSGHPQVERLIGYLPKSMAATVAAELLDQRRAAGLRPVAGTLEEIAPYLAPAALEAAIRDVSRYRYDRAIDRIEGWLALVPYLPASQQPPAYAGIFAHLAYVTVMGDYARAFRRLAPHLPPALLPEAVAAAYAVRTRKTRAQEHGGPTTRDEGEPARSLCETLTALLARLPADQQSAVADDAIAAARQIPGPQDRARALLGLLPHLPPERQAALAREALQAAYAQTAYGWSRDTILAEVVPWLIRAAGQPADGDLRDDWQRAVRGFVRYGRAATVESLGAMMPWLSTMALSEDLTAISAAVLDIVACWP